MPTVSEVTALHSFALINRIFGKVWSVANSNLKLRYSVMPVHFKPPDSHRMLRNRVNCYSLTFHKYFSLQ